jgi:hypothetical protein
MKRFSTTMSELNQLGYIINNSKEFTNDLDKKTISKLHELSGRLFTRNILSVHRPLSGHGDVFWFDLLDGIRVITLRLGIRPARVNRLRLGLENWETLDANDKNSLINDALMFMLETDTNSPLVNYLRNDANTIMQNIDTEIKLNEEDSSSDGVITASDVATTEVRLMSKPIKRISFSHKKIKKFMRIL